MNRELYKIWKLKTQVSVQVYSNQYPEPSTTSKVSNSLLSTNIGYNVSTVTYPTLVKNQEAVPNST